MTLLAPKISEIYPIGSIIEANSPPSGNWLICRGQVLAQGDYIDLYNLMDNPHPEIYSQWNFMDEYDTGGVYPLAERVQWNGSTGSPIWVACGSSQKFQRTTDGITWTIGNMPSSGDWYGPAWNGSIFCAVKYNAAACATSSAGSSWTERSLPYAYTWRIIVWDGTNFIAVSTNNVQSIYSADGITWYDGGTLADTSNKYYGASDGAGTIVVINQGGSIYYSTDGGANWGKTIGAQGSWYSVEYCNGYFLIATAQGYVGISENGYDWDWIPYATDQYAVDDVDSNPGTISRWRYYDNIYFGIGHFYIYGVYSFDLRTFHPWFNNPFSTEWYDAIYNSSSGNLCLFGGYSYNMPYASKIEHYNDSTHFQLPNYQHKEYHHRGLNRYIRVK